MMSDMVATVDAPNRTARSHVLRRLIEIQGTRSDAQMARWLGIERSYWYRMRTGKLPLSFATITRAIEKDESLLTAHMKDMMPRDGAA